VAANKLAAIVTVAIRCQQAQTSVIPAGYYLPTKIAGPMNAAIGLTDFPSLEAYASFREKMAADAEGLEIRRRVEASGAILSEERSFLSCIPESRR